MTLSLAVRRSTGVVLLALACPLTAAARQDTLARAKDYYASASYDEALQVLDQLRGKSAPANMRDIAAYQVFCLVALGRNQEATTAIEAIVKIDPLYHPSEVDASPRVRTFFENVRKPLLPTVVRDIYTRGKESLDKQEFSTATAAFDRVVTLLDEMGTTADQGSADLRTLATGFRDLSKAAAPRPAALPTTTVDDDDDLAATASPVRMMPPSRTSEEIAIYSQANPTVTAPVAIRRVMPVWHPINAIDKIRNFRGNVELLIDERGKVLGVTIAAPVHPDYDAVLARAARDWTFEPARKDGVPVKYRLAMDILLTPTK